MQSSGKFCLRLCLNRPVAATGRSIDWAGVLSRIRRENIDTHRSFNIAKYFVDHSADLEYALNKADQIAASILDSFVWQVVCINRQPSPKSEPIAFARMNDQRWSGR